MNREAYQIGGHLLGITIGNNNLYDTNHKFLTLNFFPFIFMILLGEKDLTFRIHIFNYLKFSLSLQTG